MKWYQWIVFALTFPVILFFAAIWVMQTISIYVYLYQSIFTDQEVLIEPLEMVQMVLYAMWTIQMIYISKE